MSTDRIVTVEQISPLIRRLKVAVYCRVSTLHEKQTKSLANQISYYRQMVDHRINWELADIYADVQSGRNISERPEFMRMLEDCQNHKIDLIISKSISRFGRNTAEILKVLNQLQNLSIDVYFETENIHTQETKHIFLISLLESVAQAESESRSINIKWGSQRKLENGSSKLYDRKCFGYQQSNEGNLIINEEESGTVQKVFDLYLSGYSILGIIRELEAMGIKSPTGRDRWSKRTVETMLDNEKYTGHVLVGKSFCEDFPYNQRRVNKGQRHQYLASDSHPAIISSEQFDLVHAEKLRRSNIQVNESGTTRKSTHFSMKKAELSTKNKWNIDK